MRCLACNNIIGDYYIKWKDKKWEDLCYRCRSFVAKDLMELEFNDIVESDISDLDIDEYEQELEIYDRNHDTDMEVDDE